MVSSVEKPLIHQIIPLIDQLHTRLTDLRNDNMVHMSICHAANNAIVVLNKYYSRMDECIMYCVAMSKSFNINSNVSYNITHSYAPSLQDALLHKRVLARGMDRRGDIYRSWDLDRLLSRLELSIFVDGYGTGYDPRFNRRQGMLPLLSLPSPSLSIVPHCFSICLCLQRL